MCNNIFTSLHIHIFHLKESPAHLTVCVDVLDVREAKHRNDTTRKPVDLRQWRWSAENLEHRANPEDDWRAQTYFSA